MAKKRNKKYNPKRAAQAVTGFLFRGHAVVFLASLDRVVLMNCRQKAAVQASQVTANAITELPHKWLIDMAVLCRDQFGVEYMVNQQVVTRDKHYHRDLCDVLNEQHKLLVKECNPNHVINMGWFATINDVEIDQKTQEDIYRLLNGFECLTTPEAKEAGYV